MRFLLGRSREIRTPINGFGDRYSTLELCSYGSSVAEATLLFMIGELLYDLQDLTGTYRTATLADCETQTLVQSDRVDQGYRDGNVVSGITMSTPSGRATSPVTSIVRR